MSESTHTNPAKQASDKALALIYDCIDKHKHFLVEAGAGAGKTYSLEKALQYLIRKHGRALLRQHQQIACITYTNVATDEIKSRTDGHPAILSSTIHAFCWSLIKDFQPQLRERLPQLSKWPERLAEIGGIGTRRVDYELGHPRAKKDAPNVVLGHDDVLSLTVALMEQSKFRELFAARYPILLIDEYQDTNKEFTESLKSHFLATGKGPLIGFFGDHWQKIYGDGCGKIEHPKLQVIGVGANFRSAPVIVDMLNHMRPELRQEVKDPLIKGSVAVYHTNTWTGARRDGQHWAGDLPADMARDHLGALYKRLAADGWNLAPEKTKVLMLTHRGLATEMGYSTLLEIFPFNEAFLKKEDPHIAFLVDVVEPVCAAYEKKQFGEMFTAMGERTPNIHYHGAKVAWAKDMDKLLAVRATGNVGAVLDHLKQTERPRLPETVEKREQELARLQQEPGTVGTSSIEQIRKLREVSYKEIRALTHFINEKTPFATKHGVKGAEFENVLVIFGRGWNQYDFNQMLELARTTIPAAKHSFYERNRNLFYVVCSRPQTRLALLFTQQLSDRAIATLSAWFGKDVIHPIQV